MAEIRQAQPQRGYSRDYPARAKLFRRMVSAIFLAGAAFPGAVCSQCTQKGGKRLCAESRTTADTGIVATGTGTMAATRMGGYNYRPGITAPSAQRGTSEDPAGAAGSDQQTFQQKKSMKLRSKFRAWATHAAVFGLHIYQVSKGFFLPASCRYYPTCSQYAIDAVQKYGPARGTWKAVKRVCRCHPFHPGGYDPA